MNRLALKCCLALLMSAGGVSSPVPAIAQANTERVPSFDQLPLMSANSSAPGAKDAEARAAQNLARQSAQRARETARIADRIAADARRQMACGSTTNRTGLAVFCAADGARYYGELREGMFEGLGVFVSASGFVIKGQWLNGKPHGLAVTVSETGYVYEGDMVEGIAAGYGSAIGEFGRYEGRWMNGNWNGLGVETTQSAVIAGEWRNGTAQR